MRELVGSGRNAVLRSEFLRLLLVGFLLSCILGLLQGRLLGKKTLTSGEVGFLPNNDGVTNRENLVRLLSQSSVHLIISPGDYSVDNSTDQSHRGLHYDDHIVIANFDGRITMEEGARILFTDRSRRGINFEGGRGAILTGMNLSYEQMPEVRRDSEGPITFLSTSETTVRGMRVNGSPAAGLMFFHCTKPRAYGVRIENTMADGLHFANCENGHVEGLSTTNTGDEGLAFVNYGNGPDNSGGWASDILVRDSKGRGIAVVGQNDVTVDDFTVDGTSFDGILCAQEDYWRTRVPGNVTFTNGTIRYAGTVFDPEGKVGNHSGIHFAKVRSTEFRNIEIESPRDRGISGTAAAFEMLHHGGGESSEPPGRVRIENIEVRDSGTDGVVLVGGNFFLNKVNVRNAEGTGFSVLNAEKFECGTLSSANSSGGDGLGRAFLFEDNENVRCSELRVYDDLEVPSGYVIGAYGTQTGSLGKVFDEVRNGEVSLRNQSGLDYELIGV